MSDYVSPVQRLYTPKTPAGKSYATQIAKIPGLTDRERWQYVQEFELRAGEPIIPNLDKMTHDELMNFWSQHRYGQKKSMDLLFPGWPTKGLRKIVEKLAAYASNKAAEKIALRTTGEDAANGYRIICNRIYSELPDEAKFRG